MTVLAYEKALKTVRAEKKAESYARIQLDYSTFLVLPYKKALAFLEAVEGAEIFEDRYSRPPVCKPLDKDRFVFYHMDRGEYEVHRMAHLLDLPVKDVMEMREKSLKPKTEEPCSTT